MGGATEWVECSVGLKGGDKETKGGTGVGSEEIKGDRKGIGMRKKRRIEQREREWLSPSKWGLNLQRFFTLRNLCVFLLQPLQTKQ